VCNDAAATSARIISHKTLLRFGILAETLGAVVFIGLALALHRLFEDVDRHRRQSTSLPGMARHAAAEMRALAADCRQLLAKSGVVARALDRLYWAIDDYVAAHDSQSS
jgi:hypothetical protein